MGKAVLISIRPKWCELIASGQKTIEVRKTKPNAILPLKCFIYCTKPSFFYADDRGIESGGKVIGEFVCHNIFPLSFYASDASFFDTEPPLSVPGTCLTDKEIADYLGNGKTGYGWHVSELKIYDKPKELCEFHCCYGCEYETFCKDEKTCKKKMQRPPQSWRYVDDGN